MAEFSFRDRGRDRGLWPAVTLALLVAALLVLGITLAGMVFGWFTMTGLLGFGIILVFVLVIAVMAFASQIVLRLVPAGVVGAFVFAVMAGFMVLSPVYGSQGGFMVSLSLFGAIAFLAGGTVTLIGPGPRPALLALLAVVAGVGALGYLLFEGLTPGETLNPALAKLERKDRTLALPNPGEPGSLTVARYHYGSGRDLHRPEFAGAADWTSRSVDGSALVDNWEGPGGWARSQFFGFDVKSLPVQGRVWAPETGSGPHPLVLVVHGNHAMQDFSDPGYAYLGEHLASRGFILVSVDENFLNSSLSDILNMAAKPGLSLDGGLEEENDARGWMLLEHLSQWREWNQDPEHPFFGRVDMDRVGLIGHSRGGEAVAIAAHFNTLKRYPGDASLEFDYGFGIKGVVAIAPVDGQYKPRGRGTPVSGVNYLTVHGNYDADVESFMGLTQYSRTDLAGAEEDLLVKASLYIENANHGQFNTVWGRTDFSQPYASLLNLAPLMPGEDQRDIARVYFSAFLEAALKGKRGYLPLLADAAYGAQWLPDVFMVSNFQSGDTRVLASFEEDGDPATGQGEVRISGERLTRWEETWLDLKYRQLDTHSVRLAWDDRTDKAPARYALEWAAAVSEAAPAAPAEPVAEPGEEPALPSDPQAGLEGEPAPLTPSPAAPSPAAPSSVLPAGPGDQDGSALILRFSAAWAKGSTLPDDWDTVRDDSASDTDDEEPKDEPLDWTIIVTDADGDEARLPLSHHQALHPPIEAHTRRIQWLSEIATSEPVLRRFALPLADFAASNPAFDPERITGAAFLFDRSAKGAIHLDDIGLARRF